MQAEMEGERWQNLGDDEVRMILAALPIRSQVRLRCVCKKWNTLLCSDEVKKMYKNMPLSSSPAFCIQIDGDQIWVIQENTDFYKLSSMPMGYNQHSISSRIRLADSSIYFSWLLNQKDGNGDRDLTFFLCNPASGTWRTLPCPPYKIERYSYYFFYAMGFDSSSSSPWRCTLIFGECVDGKDGDCSNQRIVEMYDSESNAWTDPINVSDGIHKSIWPAGPGVYSKGKFYWLNIDAGVDVLEFNTVAQSHHMQSQWTRIPLPAIHNYNEKEVFFSIHGNFIESAWPWQLAASSGSGRVMLVNKFLPSMWMLQKEMGEDGLTKNKWIEFPIDLPQPTYTVAINSNGQILVVGRNISIYSEDGTRLKTIEFSEIEFENGDLHSIKAFPFECNNIWWPN